MKSFQNHYSITDSVKGIDGTLVLHKELLLDNVADLTNATESSLCFYESVKYLSQLQGLKAGLVIVPSDFDQKLLPRRNIFLTEKPYLAFNTVVSKWLQAEQKHSTELIHSSVVTGKDCTIASDTILKAYVVIGDNVTIGQGTIIESNVVLGDNVKVGDNCHVYPNTTIYTDTIIGNRVIIHSACSIGSDGYGYIFSDNRQQKIHHIGNVIIEDDVEIGANSCVDRSTIGSTIIGEGTKIDNLVQIAHNCRIGRHSILCAQVGLAGNTQVGDYVYLAGQVGVAGHLKIEDGAMIGAQSGIAGNVPSKAKYFGTPAIDAGLQKRIIVCLKKLPEIVRLFNRLEKEYAENKKEEID